ncbi:Flp family type IVb pilin [Bradyrhizobium jicamae]|uniref:Flp family type IVb pilin n=1 Tax=Bradyrhizobium jicamae TaxID=280332 RepID=UPI0020116494|nr:Flp family type IVb pilin [Bradyrhizobium jicamae]
MVAVSRTPARPDLIDQPRLLTPSRIQREVIMKKFVKNLVSRFVKDEDVNSVKLFEGGLIATGIAIAIIAAVNGVGNQLSGTFNTISTSLK